MDIFGGHYFAYYIKKQNQYPGIKPGHLILVAKPCCSDAAETQVLPRSADSLMLLTGVLLSLARYLRGWGMDDNATSCNRLLVKLGNLWHQSQIQGCLAMIYLMLWKIFCNEREAIIFCHETHNLVLGKKTEIIECSDIRTVCKSPPTCKHWRAKKHTSFFWPGHHCDLAKALC